MNKKMKRLLIGGGVLLVLIFWAWQIFKPINVNIVETKTGEATTEISQPVSVTSTSTISENRVTMRVNVKKSATQN